jgi:hypothetical protein
MYPWQLGYTLFHRVLFISSSLFPTFVLKHSFVMVGGRTDFDVGVFVEELD